VHFEQASKSKAGIGWAEKRAHHLLQPTPPIEGGLILSGFRITQLPASYGQLTIAAVMWVPALATVLTIHFITHEGFAIANLRFGSWKPYLTVALLLPTCFIFIYSVTWLLGLGQPDWKFEQFLGTVSSAAGTSLAPTPSPALVLPVLFMVTLIITPFVNGVFGFGEELGWRGYLLPKLMVLGKVKAYLLVGIVWGLWHLPLILVRFTYPGQPFLGTLAFIALTTHIWDLSKRVDPTPQEFALGWLGSRRIQQSEARCLGTALSIHKPSYWRFRWHSRHYGLAIAWAVGDAVS